MSQAEVYSERHCCIHVNIGTRLIIQQSYFELLHQLNLLLHQWESNHFHVIDEGNKGIGGTVVSPSNLTQNLTALTRGTCLRNTHQYLCVPLNRWDHFYRVALSTSGFQINHLWPNMTYMRLQLLFSHIKYH